MSSVLSRFDPAKVPLWLISFLSLFFPVYFVLTEVTDAMRPKIVRKQYETFRRQTVAAVLVYAPSLIGMLVLINTSAEWIYDPNVILGNLDFNLAMASVLVSAFISLVLGVKVTWTKTFKAAFCHGTSEDEVEEAYISKEERDEAVLRYLV